MSTHHDARASATRVAARHLQADTWFAEIADEVPYMQRRVSERTEHYLQTAHDLTRDASAIDHAWERKDIDALMKLGVVTIQERQMLARGYNLMQDDDEEGAIRVFEEMDRKFGRLG